MHISPANMAVEKNIDLRNLNLICNLLQQFKKRSVDVATDAACTAESTADNIGYVAGAETCVLKDTTLETGTCSVRNFRFEITVFSANKFFEHILQWIMDPSGAYSMSGIIFINNHPAAFYVGTVCDIPTLKLTQMAIFIKIRASTEFILTTMAS
jgi:hypothetical protein